VRLTQHPVVSSGLIDPRRRFVIANRARKRLTGSPSPGLGNRRARHASNEKGAANCLANLLALESPASSRTSTAQYGVDTDPIDDEASNPIRR